MTGMSKTATNKNTLKAGTCFALFLPNPETGSIYMTTLSDPETFQLFKKKKKKNLDTIQEELPKFQTKSNQITN